MRLRGITDTMIRRIAQLYVDYGEGTMNTDDLFDRDSAVFEATKWEITDAIKKLESIGANLELLDDESVALYQSALAELYRMVENMSVAPIQQDVAI